MGGRGSSGGGGGGGGALTNQQINQIAAKFIGQQPPMQQVQTPVTPSQTIQEGMYSKFSKSTDDQKANMIDTMRKDDVPVFLANNDFQKFTYGIGGDKPKLVKDSVLDKTKGKDIYRTVNNVKDTKNGITYDADMIASQVQKGSVTRVSDSGGSVYGRGIYFADNYRDSIAYGGKSGSIKTTAVVRAKLDSNAKVISYSKATQQMRAEINSGSNLGKAIAKCDKASQVSIYAYSKGYSAIQNSSYLNILSRKSLIVSDTIKSKSSSWK